VRARGKIRQDLGLVGRAPFRRGRGQRCAGRLGASGFEIWSRVFVLMGQAIICLGDECKWARELNMRARVGPIYFWRQTD